ncbi:hypothetical protein QYF36_010590 [Acer negundo]|nr:hypothetical protein QYF36_010590 [Acer negundo]
MKGKHWSDGSGSGSASSAASVGVQAVWDHEREWNDVERVRDRGIQSRFGGDELGERERESGDEGGRISVKRFMI